ncbi:MAG: diacylglycerol kinase family lipid kinase [Bacteroidales bacterium]|nr:diacylglycerol kinase family lipid kinase [Bacteroidales bacterium]
MSPHDTFPGEWLVLVNPNAGRRKGEKDWAEISQLLVQAGIPFRAVFTHHRDHASRLSTEYLRKGFRKFIVVGGDGTLNEVVNGLLNQQEVDPLRTCIGMVPVGTGNDWCRFHKIPLDYQGAVDVLKNGRCMLHDVGRISMSAVDRFFINMAGLGYDGLVAQKTNEQKDQGKGGPFSYMFNLIASLFSYRLIDARISLDGEHINTRLFSLSVGICRYNGGGMMQAPHALPDDGLLDLTVIKKLSKLSVIRNVPKLFDGSFTRLPMVFTGQGKNIDIQALGLLIEADGESVGETPCSIGILAEAINVISGTKDQPLSPGSDSPA